MGKINTDDTKTQMNCLSISNCRFIGNIGGDVSEIYIEEDNVNGERERSKI